MGMGALAGGGGAGGSPKSRESAKGSPRLGGSRLSGWLPLCGSWVCAKDSSKASPSGGVLLGARSDEDTGKLGQRTTIVRLASCSGGEPHRGLWEGRQGGERHRDPWEDRQGGERRPDPWEGRQGGERRPDPWEGRQGGEQRSDPWGGRQGGERILAGLADRLGEERPRAGPADHWGEDQPRARRADRPKKAVAGGSPGRWFCKTSIRGRPTGGMSTTTCCPLKHFGQMTLSEATAMPFDLFYHRCAFIAQSRLWFCPGILSDPLAGSPRAAARCVCW
jgi:hypothetical protein